MHYGREASWHTAFVRGDYPAVQPYFILKRKQCYLLAVEEPSFLLVPPAKIVMSLSANCSPRANLRHAGLPSNPTNQPSLLP